jgi:hypothetical protein
MMETYKLTRRTKVRHDIWIGECVADLFRQAVQNLWPFRHFVQYIQNRCGRSTAACDDENDAILNHLCVGQGRVGVRVARREHVS